MVHLATLSLINGPQHSPSGVLQPASVWPNYRLTITRIRRPIILFIYCWLEISQSHLFPSSYPNKLHRIAIVIDRISDKMSPFLLLGDSSSDPHPHPSWCISVSVNVPTLVANLDCRPKNRLRRSRATLTTLTTLRFLFVWIVIVGWRSSVEDKQVHYNSSAISNTATVRVGIMARTDDSYSSVGGFSACYRNSSTF